MWADHLEPLAAAGLRAVAVDLAGFGDAPVAAGRDAPWNDVLQTMDALSIDRAALVGNSFGADVALRVAAVAPERVTALVLCGARAPGIEPSPELQAAWEAEGEALERGDVDAAVAAVVDAWTGPGAPAELRELVAAMQRRAFELQLGEPEPEEAPDPLDEDPGALAKLGVPALVVVGANDKPDFVQGADLLARTLSRARHTVVDDVGHLVPLEAPEVFWTLVIGFVREHPAL